MKREEAEEVWSIISAVYGLHPERSGEQATVWVPALEEMDATIVMSIVDQWMHGRGPEKLPTLVAFAGDVRQAAQRALSAQRVHDGYECSLCEDNGAVCVSRDEKGMEETGPCPSCPRGKLREFPLNGVGPWGPEGFWRDREWEKIGHQEVCIKGEQPSDEPATIEAP